MKYIRKENKKINRRLSEKRLRKAVTMLNEHYSLRELGKKMKVDTHSLQTFIQGAGCNSKNFIRIYNFLLSKMWESLL
jgi:hypothetical protein